MTSDSRCPYCGREYETYTIAGYKGRPLTIRRECGCQGAKEAAKAEYVRVRGAELTKAWRGTGVPERFWQVQPDSDGLAELDSHQGLYLSGPMGTGKTTKACRILKAYVRREQRDGWVSARFMSVPDWLASMRGQWGDVEEDRYQRAAGCKLLVLDDIGKGKPTAWSVEKLFRLVDSRYNSTKPTIFTSNYDLGDLGERYAVDGDHETADAMVSRMVEMCKGICFDGPDLRMR
jgi:predicted ATPase